MHADGNAYTGTVHAHVTVPPFAITFAFLPQPNPTHITGAAWRACQR